MKKIIRKKNIKKRQRTGRAKKKTQKGSFFVSWKSIFLNAKKVVRKEQRRCLRHKKYKNKESFCFVWALLNKYKKTVLISALIIVLLGMGSVKNTWLEFWPERQSARTQTSLLGNMNSKINSLRDKINGRKKCIDDKYWKSSTSEVCNYYLYQQENKYCAKFNVPTTRVAIGEKQCCDGDAYLKNKDKLTACPGSDIFFHKTKMHSVRVVDSKDSCYLGVCEFYPKEGFHAKMDETGKIFYDKEGNIVIEKDCPASQSVGPCSKDCGGGQRTRTIMTTNCLKIESSELCNEEPCARESN